jgi:hypothetical protein
MSSDVIGAAIGVEFANSGSKIHQNAKREEACHCVYKARRAKIM